MLQHLTDCIVNGEGLFAQNNGNDTLEFDLSDDKSIMIAPLVNQSFFEASITTNLTLTQVENPQRAGEYPFSLSILDAANNLIAFDDSFSYIVTSWPLGQQMKVRRGK